MYLLNSRGLTNVQSQQESEEIRGWWCNYILTVSLKTPTFSDLTIDLTNPRRETARYDHLKYSQHMPSPSIQAPNVKSVHTVKRFV